MKKILSILAIGVLLITACTGVKTVTRGLENEAFLTFVGEPANYKTGVVVNIDDKTTFVAEVTKDKVGQMSAKNYAITPGKHSLTVKYSGEVIVKKQIFVSAQETKKIELP